MGLTDLLDRWLEVHDELGTNGRNGLTRGATDAELGRLEDLLGFELLPQVREMLSWATVDPAYRGYGGCFLPSFAPWYMPLRNMPANSIHPVNDTPALDLYTTFGEENDDPPSPDRMMVQLFHEPGWIWVDHGSGPTNGGLWAIDETERSWVAKDLAGLIDSCLQIAERDWLINDEGIMCLNDDVVRADCRAAEERFRTSTKTTARIDLFHDVRWYRMDVFSNPALRRHLLGDGRWVW